MSQEPKRPLNKVLVANRGEIAVRVLRGLRELGLQSAVIYSDADRTSLPVLLARESHRVGPAPSSESYLRGDVIVELAKKIGADAVHPGYGFLSENADFARLCGENGITFIGPPPDAIAAMGSKIRCRQIMMDAGVPVVPGGREPLESFEDARRAAAEIGYPVMLKASAGGGGKGMRMVRNADELASAYRMARSEALSSFSDDTVYVEKFVEEPRHVEIQVLADEHGQCFSLGERECSLQRRHQKVVEEAPSPVVDKDLRRRMGEAAVKAAQAAGYVNAGTVEFLLDPHGNFYFLEMNTRLQVEHPVTEMVTGLDLVEWQLRVARGEKLPAEIFNDIQPNGHSIEVRIYAEDPFRGFAPSPGVIDVLHLPDGPGVRNDCGVFQGSEVTFYYDPMLSKMITWGHSREHAIQRMERALAEIRIDGIRTTVPLFVQIMRDEDFRAGRLDNGLLDRKLASGEWGPEQMGTRAPEDLEIVAAAVAHAERQKTKTSLPSSEGGRRGQWRLVARREAVGGSRSWN